MKKCVFILIILQFLIRGVYAENANKKLRIGIYTGLKSISFAIIPTSGIYEVYGNDKLVFTINTEKAISVNIDKNLIKLRHNGKLIGSYSKINLKGTVGKEIFRLKSVFPSSEAWPFDDDLEISASKGFLKAVNIVNIEKYVAGVLESEIGPTKTIEFLKAKSIICRTYALSHLNRHKNENFNLCDKIHCQVYKSRSRYNELIVSAVTETEGIVIKDTTGNLITAAFSANCGGQTTNSEDAWSEALYYLRSVTDPFCVNQSHATWTKEFTVVEWKEYFSSKHKTDLDCEEINCYYPYSRQITFSETKPVPLKQVRTDLKLKSTWFAAESDCEKLILFGRGFGHGVGLCQEGAMEMSHLGYCYDEIINFYYQGVVIEEIENK